MSNPNHNPQHQWQHTTSTSSGSPTTTAASSGSHPPQQHQQYPTSYNQFQPPPQYPADFAPRPAASPNTQQTSFHHYQPLGQTTTTRHQVTAPFLLPRMPHPWPFPGAQERLQRAGRGAGDGLGQGHDNVPIDPRLLSAGHGQEQKGKGPASQGQWHGSQGMGQWPPGSG